VTARLAYVNVFARDIERLARFYSQLLGFREIEAHRSPIYRCLDANGTELGFNAEKAYELLGLADRKPGAGRPPVRTYFTFELASRESVDAAAARTLELGGEVHKTPYVTYYAAYQAVLADPEQNVFRVNRRLGARPPAEASGMKSD